MQGLNHSDGGVAFQNGGIRDQFVRDNIIEINLDRIKSLYEFIKKTRYIFIKYLQK